MLTVLLDFLAKLHLDLHRCSAVFVRAFALSHCTVMVALYRYSLLHGEKVHLTIAQGCYTQCCYLIVVAWTRRC